MGLLPINYLRYLQCVLDSKLNYQFFCIHAYATVSDTVLKYMLTVINLNSIKLNLYPYFFILTNITYLILERVY